MRGNLARTGASAPLKRSSDSGESSHRGASHPRDPGALRGLGRIGTGPAHMPPVRDRPPLHRRRLLQRTVFIAAAIALLAFATSAAAETKIGEYSAPRD